MPRTYEPIASTTLGTSATSVTLSSIPGTFTDLILIPAATLGSFASFEIRVNGDTGSNYSYTYLYGNGTITGSARADNMTIINTVIQGTPGPVIGQLHFMSYANTSVFKTILMSGGAASHIATRTVGLWRSTSAITSITISSAATMASGSTFSLYGIKAA